MHPHLRIPLSSSSLRMERAGNKLTVIDKIASYELARRAAEDVYAKDPLDVDNLTRLGSALLELSIYQNHWDSWEMIDDAISKFKDALSINPQRSDTLWCLGNALTSLAFLCPSTEEAREYILEASEHFKKACEVEPDNELYRMSLHMVSKALERHADLLKKKVAQDATGPSSSSSTKDAAAEKRSNGVIRWGILVAIVAWVWGFSNK